MSDYSRPYTDEDAERDRRRIYLNDTIPSLELGKLTVQNLLDILAAYGLRSSYLNDSDHDLEKLEWILKEVDEKGGI